MQCPESISASGTAYEILHKSKLFIIKEGILEERPIINIVYAHMQQQHIFAVHCGPITVIATPLPVQGCDVYAYMDAFSFRGKQSGIDVLILHEPAVVLPGQYDKLIWDHFDYVITWYDALLERDPDKFKKIPGFRNDWLVEVPQTESMIERIRLYPVENRKIALCMIGGNRRSQVPGELYSKRIEAALWFYLYSDIPFDVYGRSPFPLPNYRGSLGTKEKFSTLAQYRFCLCYENTNHPELARGYVGKIYDCLETRTIPIYLGCPDIENYVPLDCFIDVRKFKSYRDLDDFLHAMDQKQYESYIRAIDSWVTQGGFRPYSLHATYTRLAELYAASVGKDISAYLSPAATWESGMSPSIGDIPLVSLPGTPHWSFKGLSNAVSPLIDYTAKRTDLFNGTDSRLERAQQLQKEKKYPEALRELEVALKDGFFNVEILYLFAKMLAAVSRHEESLAQLQRVIMLDPGHSRALNDLAAMYIQKKDYKRAVEYLQSAIQADVHNFIALDNLHSVLTALGLTEYLNQFMQSLLVQHPDDVTLRMVVERQLSKMGNKSARPPNHRHENFTIHCVGDGHVFVFSGVDMIGGNDVLPFFRTYRLGPHTAYNAILRRSLVEQIIMNEVRQGDLIMFCFGEIDCRAHLVKQAEAQKRSLKDVISQCMERYSKLFEFAKAYSLPLLAWNVPPPCIDDVECGEYSTYGTFQQRKEATNIFNSALQEYCEKNGVTFISIYDKLFNEDGLPDPSFFMDNIHLSQNVMPLILDELQNKGFDIAAARSWNQDFPGMVRQQNGAHVPDDPYEAVRKSLQVGRNDEAEGKIRRILTKEPHHLQALNDLGVIFALRGEKSTAFEYFLAAGQSDKTDRIAIHNLIGSFIEMGRRNDAIATLKSSLEFDTAHNLLDIGELYLDVLSGKKEIPQPLFHHSPIENHDIRVSHKEDVHEHTTNPEMDKISQSFFDG